MVRIKNINPLLPSILPSSITAPSPVLTPTSNPVIKINDDSSLIDDILRKAGLLKASLPSSLSLTPKIEEKASDSKTQANLRVETSKI